MPVTAENGGKIYGKIEAILPSLYFVTHLISHLCMYQLPGAYKRRKVAQRSMKLIVLTIVE